MHSDSMEGRVLNGRYELRERVGVGGMAVVYRAIDKKSGDIVAVKTLKEEYCDDIEFVKRFRNEVKATAELSHRNIVKIYDLGQEENMPYIVMEFIEGITLKDYIVALQTIKWRDALNIAAQVLSAVDCAHAHNVIHRDIKPQNIMITDAGQIKLTDFGIARAVSAATKPAVSDSAGSVHYLSPEQARGGFVDERSDIYSIGIMLYEMVTGVVPFDGESHVSIALKHIDGNIVPPHAIDPEIPIGVSDLILLATKKDPAERFQSAKDMYARLRLVMENPSYSFLSHLYEEGAMPDLQRDDIPPAEGVITGSVQDGSADINVGGSRQQAAHQKASRLAAEEIPVAINKAEIIRSVTLTTVAYVMAVILGVVGIIFIVTRFNNLKDNMDQFADKKYKVESYIGMQSDIVISTLTEKGIRVTQIPTESEDYPVGYIIGQSIKEGDLIDDRGEIELQVSALSGSFVLLDYSNTDYRDAGAKIGALGLTVSYQPVSSSKFADQMVVRTMPVAGSIVMEGDAVTVYYSVGTMIETVTVPNLTGYTLEQARRELELLGLNVGDIYPEPGEDITHLIPTPSPTPDNNNNENGENGASTTPPINTPDNDAQTPDVNTPDASPSEGEATGGSTSDATLATPSTPSPTPTLPNNTPTADVTAEPTGVLASETVVSQYPPSGTVVYKHETVNLYFYNMSVLTPSKEMTLEFPAETVTRDYCAVRIEAMAADSLSSISNILFNSTRVLRTEFPITYTVPLSVNKAPVRVTIYIDGTLYRELTVYE